MNTNRDVFLCGINDPIGGPLLVCEVAKTCIVRGEAGELAHVFRMVGMEAPNLASYAGKMVIGLSGFDDVTEELYEIDAPRAFIADLTRQIPWWFSIIHPSISLTWLSAITPKPIVTRERNGSISARPDWAALSKKLDEAIDNAVAHAKQVGVEGEDLETISLNMEMTRQHIMAQLDPVDLDPFIGNKLRQAREMKLRS